MQNRPGWVSNGVLTPLLLLEAFLLVGPVVRFSDNVAVHDLQRIEQIIFLAFLTLSSIWLWRSNTADILGCPPRWVAYLWLLGLGLGLGSALISTYPRFAGLEWASLILLSWATIVTAGQSRSQGNDFDHSASRVAILVVFFLCLMALLKYCIALYMNLPIESAKLFKDSFNNPRFFGQAATILLPVLAYPLLANRLSKTKNMAIYALLATFWMLAIASGTRGTWLGMSVAAVMIALVSWRASRSWLKIQALACLAGLLLFAVLFLWLPDAAQHHNVVLENRIENPLSLSKRDVIWSLAWQQILEHPWLGIGPMHLATLHNPVAAHPHNALLQLAAEWGLPATLALIGALAYGMLALLRRIRQFRQQDNVPLLICLAASLLAATTQAMVDGVIVMPYTQTLLVFVAGWTIGIYFRDANRIELVCSSKPKQAAILLLPALALGLMVWGVYPEILQRAEISRALIDQGMTPFKPRYWLHGWIP